jgi:SAP domain
MNYTHNDTALLRSLKVLDFKKVTKDERSRAERLFHSAAGKAMQDDVAQQAAALTFTPGGDVAANVAAAKAGLTQEQKDRVVALIMAATSTEEIDRLEKLLAAGIFPEPKKAAAAAAGSAGSSASASAAADMDVDTGGASQKAVPQKAAAAAVPTSNGGSSSNSGKAAAPAAAAVAPPAAAAAVAPAVSPKKQQQQPQKQVSPVPRGASPVRAVSPVPAAVVAAAPVAAPAAVSNGAAAAVADKVVADVTAAAADMHVDGGDECSNVNGSAAVETNDANAMDVADEAPAAAETAAAADVSGLTKEDAEKLKVADLKKELQARGLPTSGLKAVLLERLLEAL